MKRFHSFQAEYNVSRPKTILWIVLPAIVVVAMALLMFLMNRNVTQYNVTMYGNWINIEGKIYQQFDFDIRSTIRNKNDEYDMMQIRVLTPEEFPYILDSGDTEYRIWNYDQFSYYASPFGACYNKVLNAPSFAYFALDTEKGYFIASFGADSNLYLVGAVDPYVNPQDVLRHFSEFITIYGNK